MMTNPQKDSVLSAADENKKVATLTPIEKNSSGVTFNSIDSSTSTSQVSVTPHGSSRTSRLRSSTSAGGGTFVECMSKRRRLSKEENREKDVPSACVELLPSFDSAAAYRDPTAGSGCDSDEEDDIDQNYENGMRELFRNLSNANENSIKMEGSYNVVVLHIRRAKWYVMKNDKWVSNGICSVKFLKRLEVGEYGHGMISISIKAENLEEATTLEIDKPVKRKEGDASSNKPTYVWRATGTPTYALRFASLGEGLQWYETYERARSTNYRLKTCTSVDDVAEQMRSLSTTSV